MRKSEITEANICDRFEDWVAGMLICREEMIALYRKDGEGSVSCEEVDESLHEPEGAGELAHGAQHDVEQEEELQGAGARAVWEPMAAAEKEISLKVQRNSNE